MENKEGLEEVKTGIDELSTPIMNRRQRRIAEGINKSRAFNNSKGIQMVINKLPNGREFKVTKFLQRLKGKTITHYKMSA